MEKYAKLCRCTNYFLLKKDAGSLGNLHRFTYHTKKLKSFKWYYFATAAPLFDLYVHKQNYLDEQVIEYTFREGDSLCALRVRMRKLVGLHVS